MEKTKVALVTLGDSRKEFFVKREAIVQAETERALAVLQKDCEVYCPPVVITPQQGLACADAIRQQGICCVILHIPVWCTPSLSLRVAAATSLPVLLLGNRKTDTSSLVALLAVAGQLSQTGKDCVRLSGDVQDQAVAARLRQFVEACAVVDGLRRSSFCAVGGRSIGIGTTVADPSQWQKLFGVEYDHCDQYEVVQRAEKADPALVARYMSWLKEKIPTIQYGDRFTEYSLERQVRSYLAMKQIVAERGYDFLGMKCQQELSDNYALQCISVMLLNNSFDAEGPKKPVPTSCECDCDGALTMRMLSLCAGGRPSNLVDIKYFSGETQEFILANCGAVAPYFADPQDPDAAMAQLALLPHIFGLAGGAAIQMIAKPGHVTVARLFRRDGKYVLGCFEGELEMRDREELRKTTYCYPHEFIRANVDYDLFFETINSNHLHTVHGSYAKTLQLVCGMLGIEYLCYNKK